MAFICLIIFCSADVPFPFFSPSGFVHVQGGGGGGMGVCGCARVSESVSECVCECVCLCERDFENLV